MGFFIRNDSSFFFVFQKSVLGKSLKLPKLNSLRKKKWCTSAAVVARVLRGSPCRTQNLLFLFLHLEVQRKREKSILM